jgi:hypothetical protein
MGHSVKVFLPADLDISKSGETKVELNIDEIDFFKGREHVGSLIKREQSACFYSLSKYHLITVSWTM